MTLTDHFTLITRTLISICLLIVLLIAMIICRRKGIWTPFKGSRSVAITLVILAGIVVVIVSSPWIVRASSTRQIRSTIEKLESCTSMKVTHSPQLVEWMCNPKRADVFLSEQEKQRALNELRGFVVDDRDAISKFAGVMATAEYWRGLRSGKALAEPNMLVHMYEDGARSGSFGVVGNSGLRVGLFGLYHIRSFDVSSKISKLNKHALAVRINCAYNLRMLSILMSVYKERNDGRHPEPSRSCDLIYMAWYGDRFMCDGEEEDRCHYALNPSCEPNSPPDTVLLFETNAGWNQFGGPEILVTERHEPRGCNVLLNDGRIRFVTEGQLSTLKW